MGGWIILFIIGAVIIGSVARFLGKAWDRDDVTGGGNRMPSSVPEEEDEEEELSGAAAVAAAAREGRYVRPETAAERAEYVFSASGKREETETPASGGSEESERVGEERGSLFGPEGFDPGKAVIYSEVLRRKY